MPLSGNVRYILEGGVEGSCMLRRCMAGLLAYPRWMGVRFIIFIKNY